VSLSFLVDEFSVEILWIPGSDFRHLGWGLVSAIIDGLPLGFITVGESFRLKVLRLMEGQISEPENLEISTCFKTKDHSYIKSSSRISISAHNSVCLVFCPRYFKISLYYKPTRMMYCSCFSPQEQVLYFFASLVGEEGP
jgi:hypothetical protein